MGVRLGVGALGGDGDDIQARENGLRVGTLVGGDGRLRDHRVHDAAQVRLPRVGGAADEHSAGALKQPRRVQGAEDTDDAGRIAGHHPGAVEAEGGGVIGLGDERMPSGGVGFATLQHRFHPSPAVALQVAGRDMLGGGVDDHVALREQLVEAPVDGHTRVVHTLAHLSGGGEHGQSVRGGLDAPVGGDVCDADQAHVRLQEDRVSDALADDAIAVDADSDGVHERAFLSGMQGAVVIVVAAWSIADSHRGR